MATITHNVLVGADRDADVSGVEQIGNFSDIEIDNLNITNVDQSDSTIKTVAANYDFSNPSNLGANTVSSSYDGVNHRQPNK